MSLSGVLVSSIEIESDGKLFHQLVGHQTQRVPGLTPTNIQAVELQGGSWGSVGSVISWKYVLDGKDSTCKELIEEINEEEKLIKFRVIEGDFLENYKSMIITSQVVTEGENREAVAWIIEYEKLNDYTSKFRHELSY